MNLAKLAKIPVGFFSRELNKLKFTQSNKCLGITKIILKKSKKKSNLVFQMSKHKSLSVNSPVLAERIKK